MYSLVFLRNCFEEGSNLAILSRKYAIPEDNPYGDGLVELIDRMLTVDYKARADMTEVILCLSAVYSGRPLPPRKKTARTAKPDEKEQNKKTTVAVKKETPSDTRIGKFRTDSQGFRDENIYDPSKVSEGKKLASNSVAARRKRAAVSSAAVSTSGPTSNSPTPTSAPVDPLTFSSIQGSDDEATSDVAFSSFGELSGFDSKAEDFFHAFDKNKEDQQQFQANDGFDPDAFGAGWGETTTATESSARTEENIENLQKLTLNSSDSDADNAKNDGTSHRARARRKSNSFDGFEGDGDNTKNDGVAHRPRSRGKSSDSFDSFDSFDADNTTNEGAPHPKQRRKSNCFDGNTDRASSDGTHRPKQRRKSYGGRSRGLRDTTIGTEPENAGADVEKKERRSKKDSGKNEDERRRRSLSRSRRKPRRGSTTKLSDDKGSSAGDTDKKMSSKAASIRNMFNRKQSNEDS